MELGSSLPYPQVPAICPYPEPTPSSPYDPLQLPEDPSLCYPPIYVLVSLMASFPQSSPPTPCAHLYPPPYAPHAPPISFFSILPPAQPLVQKKTWRGSLPIDMLLSAVYVLVVAQSISEIPEGLMNNPV
jgi:hypothetical protein